jgi:phosphoserine phosphatase
MLTALDFDGALALADPYVRLAAQNGTKGEVAALLNHVAAGDLAFERGLRSAVDHHVAVVSDAPERVIRSYFIPDEFRPASVVANTLESADSALMGIIRGLALGRTKAECLDVLATREGTALSETVAVGDNRCALSLLQTAGTGIAVDPEPLVGQDARRLVNVGVVWYRLDVAGHEFVHRFVAGLGNIDHFDRDLPASDYVTGKSGFRRRRRRLRRWRQAS